LASNVTSSLRKGIRSQVQSNGLFAIFLQWNVKNKFGNQF
jgi:hypothetical protein